MGQHGRNRTGLDHARGSRAFTTERHDLPPPENSADLGFSPALSGPEGVRRPRSGLPPEGPEPIAGSPDTSPRVGFDGVNRRVQQADPDFWRENERRHAPWTYPGQTTG